MNTKTLFDNNPNLSKEWHPTKNGKITAKDVAPRTGKKYWWRCPKNKNHEWEASPDNRSRGKGCPYCCGKKVLKEESLGAKYPHLLKEWDKSKNGSLTPFEVTVNSNLLVWWQCSKDVSHIWKTSISSRSSGGNCPYCSEKKLCPKKSLLAVAPRLAQEIHPSLNNGLEPRCISAKSDRSIFWKCLKNEAHPPWKAQITCRIKKDAGCPNCRIKPKIPFEKSIAFLNPALASQLHPSKNNGITSDQISPGSGLIINWQCPINSKHIWPTKVAHRSNGSGCPFCTNMVSKENQRLFAELSHVLKDFKIGLEVKLSARLNVDIILSEIKVAIEWDSLHFHIDSYERDLKKTALIKKAGYTCIRLRHSSLPWKIQDDCLVIPHRDEIKIDHVKKILKEVAKKSPNLLTNPEFSSYMERKSWIAPDPTLSNDYQKRLPISGRALAEAFPLHGKFWHPQKNGKLLPSEVYGTSHQEVFWQCLENPEHEWEAKISTFTSRDPSCSYCQKRKVSEGYNLAVVHPHLLIEWAQDLNQGVDPSSLSPGTGRKVMWRCKEGHCWSASVHNRAKGNGCPYCSGKKASVVNSLNVKFPQLADEFHKTLNMEHTPLNVTPGSHLKVWWQCSLNCEHTWQSTIKNRASGRGCPFCSLEKRKNLTDKRASLAIL